jgi:hypothetical protein
MISKRTLGALVLGGLLSAAAAGAQQPTAPEAPARPKAPQAIEIRGQVPTPQVVTVRPRQIPAFSREVLTPSFFDRRFWESLVLPYQIVPDLSAAAGATPVNLTVPPLPADSSHRPSPADSGRTTGATGSPFPNPGPSPSASAGDVGPGPTSNAPREK